jgi:hypothetical protein
MQPMALLGFMAVWLYALAFSRLTFLTLEDKTMRYIIDLAFTLSIATIGVYFLIAIA